MNNENLQFLQDSLRYLGFGEKLLLNRQLMEYVTQEAKEFRLETEAFFDDETRLELRLHFRRSDQMDMYFFNKYESKLHHPDDPAKDREQTFYISKGTGVGLREAYNLLEGRAVNKDLTNAEGEKYNAWIQLDFGEMDAHHNYKVRKYGQQYGYDLEKTLEKYPIRELNNENLKTALIRALKKGDLHPVSFDKSNKTETMLIEANPRFKTINIYSTTKRPGEKNLVKQDHAVMGAHRPGGDRSNAPEQAEDETDREEPEEIKEEELELPAGKSQTKKKSCR